MPELDSGLLSFDEFRDQVGAAESAVRRALREMGLKPIPLFSDMRRTGYKPEWVAEVRQWIKEKLVGESS
jgi:hypothetical protein